MNQEIENKLSEIFYLVFDLDASTNLVEINNENTAKWDSLSHVTLITAIENEFDVFLDTEDTRKMTSYTNTLKLVMCLVAT